MKRYSATDEANRVTLVPVPESYDRVTPVPVPESYDRVTPVPVPGSYDRLSDEIPDVGVFIDYYRHMILVNNSCTSRIVIVDVKCQF